ncbi:MAG: hypothetical protein MJ212_06405 [Alphaproteobacteria bacterium]|nr:hypothetical protein [Alphaproteobacteria bacterium]
MLKILYEFTIKYGIPILLIVLKTWDSVRKKKKQEIEGDEKTKSRKSRKNKSDERKD